MMMKSRYLLGLEVCYPVATLPQPRRIFKRHGELGMFWRLPGTSTTRRKKERTRGDAAS
jgi:hypothetical protein